MTVVDRTMGTALGALRTIASSDVLDRLGVRTQAEKLLFNASKNGFRAATVSGRAFTQATKLAQPARQPKARSGGLFDLTPSEEQQMLVEAFGAFGSEQLRPAAEKADHDAAAPAELLAQANELGTATLGIPEELGGPMSERSAVTGVLVAEALARGDLGLAVAVLAPSAVATAISYYGDADQQGTYLPAFAGDDVPAAALAVLEPQPLFDPFALQTTAVRGNDGGFVLNGVKALVPRAADAELFVVAAALDGAPALFVVESGAADVRVAPDPAMGVRAAALGRVVLEDVAVPAGALLGDADPEVYRDLVRRARIAWSALAVGTAQAALDHLIPYVNERQAFGEPISHRQAVAFTISNIAIELEGMRLTTYRAASLADRGKPFAEATAYARQLAATKGMQIGSDAVQLLGGHGYVREYPEERWFRDLRAAGVMEGALLV